MQRATVLYDEDCGFCRWTADRLRTWDRRQRLTFASIQGDVGERALGALDPNARLASWHLVTDDGSVWSGGRAVPELMRRLPGGTPVVAAARRFPGATDRAYRWAASNRDRLGRLLRQRACAVDPGRARAPR
jgi:predicted DCC family thiol-disulfide oxidoreductase YuxK